jgi:hypothetical protein
MQRKSGRHKEAILIQQANRAAAVGRLLLGEVQDWNEFLDPEVADLASLPRRQLKSGKADVRARLSPELRRFCEKNFVGMNVMRLSQLYEEIKAFRGIELPLAEFESRFARVRREVLKGNPAHLTISISLWGFQLKIPEEHLARNVIEAVELANDAEEKLVVYKNLSHIATMKSRDEIGALERRKRFAARSAVIACFNLMEAYLNGLAWDYLRTTNPAALSASSRKLLDDSASASIREKLRKYPVIISGATPWTEPDSDLAGFLDIVKPFRDSLVHPSPFSAPIKFGGHDKLRKLYRIDSDTAQLAASLTTRLIARIHKHVNRDTLCVPGWFEELFVTFGAERATIEPGD